MTVVLEEQVKTITAEISEQFGAPGRDHYDAERRAPFRSFAHHVDIEDVVRAVIAQYDISNIPRLEVPLDSGAS